ncbi:MAG: rhomboid family intramembrane serine protease [Taibaiella sp.]|nr:rhomboid family intramembrane serine protease [Taibaiella sp.]
MSITIIIIAITVIVSLVAFSNEELLNKLIFYPAQMNTPGEYYRFITAGLIHADFIHLFFNMYVLYIFGENVEYVYTAYIGKPYLFGVMYFLALIAASLPSFAKHRDNYYYRALGASGAVAAVLFSFVYYAPWTKLYLFGVLPIPAIIFAALYLIYSAYAAKKGRDNVGHDAHFWGAVFGFVFTIIFDPSHGQVFIQQALSPRF